MKTQANGVVFTEPDSMRRRLLGRTAALAAGLICAPVMASLLPSPDRELTFSNLHTGERLRVTYWSDDQYLPDALAQIDQVLRDHRVDQVHPIDPGLLDQLHAVQNRLNLPGEFRVVSAYRAPATNAKLRARSNGVAKRSLHMVGKALDVRLAGCDTGHLHQAALTLGAGGVGYYPRSNFVHLDTGRVRSW